MILKAPSARSPAADLLEASLYAHQAVPTEPFDRNAILGHAKQAVADRGLNYGKPEDNFGRIAALWRSHLGNREACEITAVDVAIMLALVKVARLGNDPTHKDSWVDLAGYAACGGEVALKKA